MFKSAIPVYLKGQSEEMNTFATFPIRTGNLQGAELHLAAAAFYQVWVNGEFAAFGPARTAKGYGRKDILSLDRFRGENNEILIHVAGYFCKSYNGVRQPSFLQAEVLRGDEILYATDESVLAYDNGQKIRKVPRYSLQRQFSEVWDKTKDPFASPLPVETVKGPEIIHRVAPYPSYEKVNLSAIASRGTLTFDPSLPYVQRKYSGGGSFDSDWGEYPPEEVVHYPYTQIQRHRQTKTDGASPLPITLNKGEYAILDFGRIECGFFRFTAESTEGADFLIGFSEGGSGDRFEYTNMNALNAAEFFLPSGEVSCMTFEPYTAKYVILCAMRGNVTLKSFGITSYESDTSAVSLPDMGDEALNAVARGALRSYAHNAVDLYTDCPSRERAGWLCDSYFTGKTEYFLYGAAPTESAYLENYRLYENDGLLPEGALPMSYPSDVHQNGKFIPQWTMWYILECAEHLLERNPSEDREKFRPSIEKLLDFYRKHENSDGLLERLPSWNFVEWSAANQWTWDVNYPTNFLYAEVLQRVADLYGDEKLRIKGKQIAAEALKQSFDGTVFRDHALRNKDGRLIRQEHCSEICQYYALRFTDMNLNDPVYSHLKHLITEVFGAERKEDLPNIEPINAFIGVYLRLEALLKAGLYETVLRDIRDFFGCMEQETGTLWEYREGKGSRDHGFASYAAVAMHKALTAKK